MRVAVLIPTYNRPEEVRRAVESALRSDLNVEVLVGDDGSTPPVRLDLPKVKVVRFPHTGNPSLIRNRLAGMTDAPLLAFLDDDDEFPPGKLDTQVEEILRRGYGATFSNVVVVDARTGKTLGLAYPPSDRPLRDRILFPFARDGVVVQVGALVVRREVFLKVGGFNERLTLLEDWELSVRLVVRGLLHFHDFPGLIHYQNREDSLRARQTDEVEGRYSTLIDVLSGYLDGRLLRRVKAHLYGALSYRFGRRKVRSKALKYALKSLKHGLDGIAIRGLVRALMP